MPDGEVGIMTTLRAKRPRNRDSSPGADRKLALSEEVQSASRVNIHPYSKEPSRAFLCSADRTSL